MFDPRDIKEKVLTDPVYQRAINLAPEGDRENIENIVMHVVEKLEKVNSFLREALEDPEKAEQIRKMLEGMAKK